MSAANSFWKSCGVYSAPFALFMVLTYCESSAWASPRYELFYTAKIVLVVAVLCGCRKYYPQFSTRGLAWAVLGGVIGFGAWVGLIGLQSQLPPLPQWLESILAAGRAAYVPEPGGGLAVQAFVAVRLAGLVLVVPLMEELFWRGFLARFLISDDFESVSIGEYTAGSFVIVTLAFTAVHPEILAALVWGAGINLLCWKTRNLWACCLMHALTNGLLGCYILATGSWELW